VVAVVGGGGCDGGIVGVEAVEVVGWAGGGVCM
jgi:hypothetical protein